MAAWLMNLDFAAGAATSVAPTPDYIADVLRFQRYPWGTRSIILSLLGF